MNKPIALGFVKLISIFELFKGLAGLISSIAIFILAVNTIGTAFADAFTMVFIGLIVFIFSILYLVAAVSLWKLRRWSRVYIISLLTFPIGNFGAIDSYMVTAIVLASINLLFIYLLGFNRDVKALF